ncbi:hypothetical protein [Sulfuracidifex tepidarius]|uniref:HEPN domain-containing protein n=1 Tax=Sulfuracidifex tepidarius TaxID=1294262 RepID=A0A510DSQ6_9CREN|nr:hypothetical protein [Sulfuracidifex tepidarius]BBG23236.1 hypothetical protein IC006_0520 [Sulfuracidifex tepidarius]BBG25986.1 hypothetical protein IC007_0491 [Sulfuracidifex tepidarius]
MPIRDEETYARMSVKDFEVAYVRLKRGDLKLAAFRAYKAERRLLQCLAMIHGIHRRNTPCAVPKGEMKDVACKLEGAYEGISEMTSLALSLFNERKQGNPSPRDIRNLLSQLRYEWIKQFIGEEIEKIQKIKNELQG